MSIVGGAGRKAVMTCSGTIENTGGGGEDVSFAFFVLGVQTPASAPGFFLPPLGEPVNFSFTIEVPVTSSGNIDFQMTTGGAVVHYASLVVMVLNV